MNRTNLVSPTTPPVDAKRGNWPPVPKVKEYDANGLEKPRPPDSPEVAELKRDKAILLFEASNAAKLDESLSTIELQRPEIRGPLTSAANTKKEVDLTRSSLVSLADSVTKMLAVETVAGADGSTEEPQPILVKSESRKKRLLEEMPKSKKKVTQKQIPRMSRLALGEYLKMWDTGSNSQRIGLITKFLEDYSSQDPLDLDYYLSKGGSLIFTRFLVGMQISFQCKKHVANHFLALGIFITSLDGERYTYEFGLAGGFQTTFEVLRVHEMSNHDKMHTFHFLYSLVDGKAGSSAKRLLCNDTSYLECVVDCLTMCQNAHVIKEAKQFLKHLCVGNASKNLVMISKYIISLLPCDFNPQIQAMACDVLQGIINQSPEVASGCCTLIVDVLKSNYDDALVDVGNVCLAIMGTPSADELLYHLIEAAQPYNLLENLMSPGVVSNASEGNEFPAESLKSEGQRTGTEEYAIPPPESDPYFRLQYGAIYVLSYMAKNQTESADWMIERGVIGSLLSGIGTPCYTSVQLEAIRLLLLLHELSPDCSLALASLLPEKLLTALLTEHEEMLQYITAVMALVLRRLGTRVQENWTAWFTQVSTPGSGRKSSIQLKSQEASAEGEDADETPYDALYEIDTLVELLERSLNDPFVTIVEGMKLIFPEPSVIENYINQTMQSSHDSVSRHTMQRLHDKASIGEEHIQETEALEPFRKYLRKDHVSIERVDEFEKYYAAKFIMASEAHSVDLDAMQLAALQDAEQGMKNFKDPFKIGESASDTHNAAADNGAGFAFDDNDGSGQDQMLNL